MQYEDPLFSRFNGENIDIGLDGGDPYSSYRPDQRISRGGYVGHNPNFGPTYNYQDDHLYGYSDRPVVELAKERMTRQNGLDYDNVGRKYPGPSPPQDYSYFDQRNPLQGFTSQGMSPAARDYAIIISSNVHYFVLLLVLVLSIVIGIINMGLIFSLRRNRY